MELPPSRTAPPLSARSWSAAALVRALVRAKPPGPTPRRPRPSPTADTTILGAPSLGRDLARSTTCPDHPDSDDSRDEGAPRRPCREASESQAIRTHASLPERRASKRGVAPADEAARIVPIGTMATKDEGST